MTLESRLVALAQVVGADVKQLRESAGTTVPVTAMSVAYTNGRVTSVTEDGATTSVSYDAKGRVSSVSYPRGGLTRTEAYTYNTDGTLASMAATEA